jgi:hypothetical protein
MPSRKPEGGDGSGSRPGLTNATIGQSIFPSSCAGTSESRDVQGLATIEHRLEPDQDGSLLTAIVTVLSGTGELTGNNIDRSVGLESSKSLGLVRRRLRELGPGFDGPGRSDIAIQLYVYMQEENYILLG